MGYTTQHKHTKTTNLMWALLKQASDFKTNVPFEEKQGQLFPVIT